MRAGRPKTVITRCSLLLMLVFIVVVVVVLLHLLLLLSHSLGQMTKMTIISCVSITTGLTRFFLELFTFQLNKFCVLVNVMRTNHQNHRQRRAGPVRRHAAGADASHFDRVEWVSTLQIDC